MKKDYLYYLIIIILPIFLFINLIDIDKIINDNRGDLTQFTYPNFYFTTQSIYKGNINLWNPYNFLGEPFIGNIQTAMFYPFNILFFNIFPLNFAISFSIIFHIILAGIFMYILCKNLGLNQKASLFSSIIFMFNVHIINMTGHFMILCALTYIPIIFYFFKKALENLSIKFSFIAGFFLGISWLFGAPQISFYTSFLLGLYFIFYILNNKINFKNILNLSKFIAIPLFFSIFVAAIQLFPFIEFSQYSIRNNGVSFDYATVYSMSLPNFLTFFTPNFFGNGQEMFYWLKGSTFTEMSPYLGILSLFLIIFAIIFKRNEKHIKFFIFMLIFSLILSLGKNTPFYYILYLLPFFNSLRVPSRFLIVFVFSASIIAGYGFQFLSQKITKNNKETIKKIMKKSVIIIFIIFLLAGINISFIFYNYFKTLNIDINTSTGVENTKVTYSGKTFSVFEVLKNALIEIILFLLFFILTWFLINKIINKKLSFVYLFLFLIFNLFFYNYNNIKIGELSEIESPNELNFFKDKLGLFRYYDSSDYSNYNIIDGYYSIYGANPINLEYFTNFFSINLDNKRFFNISTNFSEKLTYEKLNLMGVKYIFSPSKINYDYYNLINETENYYIYENNDIMPRSFIYSNESNSKKCNLLNIELNKINNILLNNYCLFDYSNITYYSPSKVIININSNVSGYLVLTDTFYVGWKAYIDGNEQKIEKIFDVFRAVEINENTKEVIFSYEPYSFKLGLAFSLLSLMIFLIILFIY